MYQEATTKTRMALNLKGNEDGRQNDEQITIFFLICSI